MKNSGKYFIHPSAIVETTKIGLNTRVWAFSHIMENVTIGKDCNIGEHCYIESGVKIGSNTVIKNGIAIWKGVRVEDGVFLGPNVVLTNDLNPRSGFPKPLSEIIIRKGASIGAATPVQQGSDGKMEATSEKVVSYMRAEMRATAQKRNRPPRIAEAMVDADIEIKDGRYGAYVTDGKINATIPKGEDVNLITLERAIALILEKQAKGPTKRFKRKK